NDRVLEEPQPKLRPRFALVFGDRLEARQETPRFQEDEPRREGEERRDLVGGKRGHGAYSRKVCVGEIPEPHGENVELLFLDELEEQVQRPVESFDGHARRLRFHHGRASRSARARSLSSSVTGSWWCRAMRRTTRSDAPSSRAISAPRRA